MVAVTYKNHTIDMNRHQQWTVRLTTFTCSGPYVNGTRNTGTYSSPTAPWLIQAEQARLSLIKQQIDDAVPPEWWWEEWGWTTTENHTAPNGNVYVLTIYQDGHVTFPSQAPWHEWEIISKPSLQAAKDYIDQNNPAPGGGGGWEPESEPWEGDYPMPTIVFGTPAEVPQAGPLYQAARNDMIAQMIKDQMSGITYTTWQQAAQDYYQMLMGIVNSHGGNIQINMQTWQITSNDGADYANTSSQIRQQIRTLFGISWWDWLVNYQWWGWTGWTGWTGEGTGNEDIETTTDTIQQHVDEMNQWLTDSFNANLADWQSRLAAVPDFGPQIADRIASLNESFQNAWDFLKAWADLEAKAQAIYSNENINNMKQQLISKWFDVGKAWPAVFFKAMKDRASLSAEIYKIQADEQKTLADLESKRGQFIDSIKAAGMEADQWVFQQVNELTKQIETLRNNYDAARIQNESNFIMKPLIDVLSLQRQADLQNIIQKYQTQYLNANPSEKIVAAAKIFGSDWSYVQASVAMNTSWTFGEYLARCAESIREWKIAEAGAWASNITVTWGTWWTSYA
jgi:hypothetical protein